MEFASSPRSTVGIEWELQLIDSDSFDLRQSADAVMDQVEGLDGSHKNIHREMLLNTVELVSSPHATIAECCADLQEGIDTLEPIVTPLRISLASSGSHPFANPTYQRVTDSERYAELVDRTQYWGRQMLLYGVHVHVGVEERDKVLPILCALTTRFAQLQSLSASSPFWAGVDTAYASNRAMVFQQLPTAGIPRQFRTWDELEHYTDDMISTGVIKGFDEIRWDVRPSPKLGTVENRVFDAATNILEVAAFAALTHCLVEHYSRMIDAGEQLPVLPEWFVAENKWRSARYGMDAVLVLDAQGHQEHVRDTVESMLEDLAPVARDLRCAEELDGVHEILRLGASYQRQRFVAENSKDPLDAVAELIRAEMRADRPLDPTEFLESRTVKDPGAVHNPPC